MKLGETLRLHTNVYPGPNAACGGDTHFTAGEKYIVFADWVDAQEFYRRVRNGTVLRPESFRTFLIHEEDGEKEIKDLDQIFKDQ